MQEHIVHERTLLGAIDSFMGTLVRTRPQLAAAYGEHLEDMADHWLAGGYPNLLDAVATNWVSAYLASSLNREEAQAAIEDLYTWAQREGLVARSPLGGFLV